MDNTLYDPYNLFRPADDSSDVKAFNSTLNFATNCHEISREDREAKIAAVQRLIQKTKDHISKGN